MAAQIVLTPTPNSAVAVTSSSLQDSFRGNQLKSWSLWAGGILLGASWRPTVLLELTLDKYLTETRVLEEFLQHFGFSCQSLMLQLFGHIPFREYVWSPGSPPALLYPRLDNCGISTLFLLVQGVVAFAFFPAVIITDSFQILSKEQYSVLRFLLPLKSSEDVCIPF